MKTKIIFFGNGALSDTAFDILSKKFDIIFHAKTKEDLEIVKKLKHNHPDTYGVLASFGVMVKNDVLELFEPEGILNIHPSLLPKYRGASPIETAILNGDNDFSISVMKLVKQMDAGPIYYQTTLKDLPLDKTTIYHELSKTGATWIAQNLAKLPNPTEQTEDGVSFTTKFDKSMSTLKPSEETADQILRKIVAFQGFPKTKYSFLGKNCILIKAHISDYQETPLSFECKDKKFIVVDELQPESKNKMTAKAFLNGYQK